MDRINSFSAKPRSNGEKETRNKQSTIWKSKLTFDKQFKQLFSKKEFLVPILKNIIPEYQDYELEEIEQFITPHSDVGVEASIIGFEDVGKGTEVKTCYDVLVDCELPDGMAQANVIVDLEMQRENDPGYPIVKRGVYYCCRLISRQIERLGEGSYNQLVPVYSIWIIVNGIPKGFENSIFTAGMFGHLEGNYGDVSRLNAQMDLIHLILIYLTDKRSKESQSNLIRYLQSVFIPQQLGSSANPYNEYSKKIETEVSDMALIADVFEAMAEERGEARGREEGEARGRLRGVVSVLLEMGKDHDEIISYLTTMKDPISQSQAEEVYRKMLEE